MHIMFVRQDGQELRLHHNSDWSGKVTLVHVDDEGTLELTLPADLIVQLARKIERARSRES